MKVVALLAILGVSHGLQLSRPLISLTIQSHACRSPAPVARMPPEDALALGATAVILLGAGLLQAQVTGGERGIGAYLSKEKAQNPFYNYKTAARRPRPSRDDDDEDA